jgi:hypothetical protein
MHTRAPAAYTPTFNGASSTHSSRLRGEAPSCAHASGAGDSQLRQRRRRRQLQQAPRAPIRWGLGWRPLLTTLPSRSLLRWRTTLRPLCTRPHQSTPRCRFMLQQSPCTSLCSSTRPSRSTLPSWYGKTGSGLCVSIRGRRSTSTRSQTRRATSLDRRLHQSRISACRSTPLPRCKRSLWVGTLTQRHRELTRASRRCTTSRQHTISSRYGTCRPSISSAYLSSPLRSCATPHPRRHLRRRPNTASLPGTTPPPRPRSSWWGSALCQRARSQPAPLGRALSATLDASSRRGCPTGSPPRCPTGSPPRCPTGSPPRCPPSASCRRADHTPH